MLVRVPQRSRRRRAARRRRLLLGEREPAELVPHGHDRASGSSSATSRALWLMDVGERRLPAGLARQRRGRREGARASTASCSTTSTRLERGTSAARRSPGTRTTSDYAAAMTSFMRARSGPGLQSRGLARHPEHRASTNWWEQSGLSPWDTLGLLLAPAPFQEYFSKWSYDSAGWFTDDGGYHNDWSVPAGASCSGRRPRARSSSA